MNPAVAARVALGAAHLDAHAPGWADRIDCDRLALADPRSCLLAQAFPRRSFGDSVAALGLTSRLAEHGLSVSAAARDDGGMIVEAEIYWDELEAAWKAEIGARTGGRGPGRWI
jgi:hypothetical protein